MVIFWHLIHPHDLLVMKFWLNVILTCIRDSAMSWSYALFWSFCSWDHSSHNGLDPVSSVFCERSFCYNRNCTSNITIEPQLRAVPYCISMFWAIMRIFLMHVPVTWESHVTSSLLWAILAWRKHKNELGDLMLLIFRWTWSWVPDEAIV